MVVPVISTRIEETGTLIRDGGAFYLRRDLGGRYELELRRTLVVLVKKRGDWSVRWSVRPLLMPKA